VGEFEVAAGEPTLRAKVDVLDARIHTEAGELEETGEPPIGARGPLAFEQETEAIFEAQGRDVGDAPLLLEGLGHAGESEGMQERDGGFNEHVVSPLVGE
jgi:hypothetical protein